jgi:hypothetical protein
VGYSLSLLRSNLPPFSKPAFRYLPSPTALALQKIKAQARKDFPQVRRAAIRPQRSRVAIRDVGPMIPSFAAAGPAEK